MKKLKNIKPGEIFIYGGFEWVKLSETLVIKHYTLLNGSEFDEQINDWSKSELRRWLNERVLKDFIANGAKEEDFLSFERDLTAFDGTNDYGNCMDKISIISCEELEKYQDLIPVIENWWWTLTPVSCSEKYSDRVRTVKRDGSVGWYYVYDCCHGVRPVCSLKPETKVSTIEDEERWYNK